MREEEKDCNEPKAMNAARRIAFRFVGTAIGDRVEDVVTGQQGAQKQRETQGCLEDIFDDLCLPGSQDLCGCSE